MFVTLLRPKIDNDACMCHGLCFGDAGDLIVSCNKNGIRSLLSRLFITLGHSAKKNLNAECQVSSVFGVCISRL
jgi:hypothetical protein